MTIHPRTAQVNACANHIREYLAGCDLTLAETLHALASIQISYATMALRAERGERQAGE